MGAVVARRLQVVGGLMRHRSLQIGRTWSALLIAICFRTGRRTGECWSQVYGGGGCTAVTGGGGSHAPSLAPDRKNMVCAPDRDLLPHGSPDRRVLEPGLWGRWLHGGYRWWGVSCAIARSCAGRVL